jgi:hypothetical protein
MAFEAPDFVFSMELGVAIPQFRAAKRNSSGKAVLPTAGGRISGVHYEDGAVGETDSFVITGITIMETGGAVADGAEVAVDASGRAVVSVTAGHHIIGEAWEPATGAGQFIAVLLGYRGVV